MHRYLMHLVGPVPVDELGSLSRSRPWISNQEDLMHSHFPTCHALLPLLLNFEDTCLRSIIHGSRGSPSKKPVNEVPVVSRVRLAREGKGIRCLVLVIMLVMLLEFIVEFISQNVLCLRVEILLEAGHG